MAAGGEGCDEEAIEETEEIEEIGDVSFITSISFHSSIPSNNQTTHPR